MPVIECENLSIGYGLNIVKEHISFSIEQGSYVCILGENGAGKSTLIKTMLGFIPPMSGTILVNKDIAEEGIGYLPQQDSAQRSFPTTVLEVVLSGRQNKAKLFYSANDKRIAEKRMELMNISNLRNKCYADLSGGQQQRVLLARALCVSDKLLILDEPVTGLDIKNQELLYKIIEDLNRKGTTILMITHDSKILTKNATHILDVRQDEVSLLPIEKYKEAHNG